MRLLCCKERTEIFVNCHAIPCLKSGVNIIDQSLDFLIYKKNHLGDGLYSSRQVYELKALNPIFYISCVNIVLLTKLVLSRTFSNA